MLTHTKKIHKGDDLKQEASGLWRTKDLLLSITYVYW